jgi:hypothetical protein
MASIHLLESVGFQRDGYARAYLRINGRWQDHVLFALLDSDPVRKPSRPLEACAFDEAAARSGAAGADPSTSAG